MKRKLTYGVGYDSGGVYPKSVAGRNTKEYAVWHSMMSRCYNKKYQEKKQTYQDCEVCSEWHDFQSFAKWFVVNGVYDKGFQIDKDLLCAGNKVYSPDTVCFVPSCINNLVITSKAIRGDNPIGVTFRRDTKKYQAQINIKGTNKKIGVYFTAHEAHKAYVVAKEAYVKRVANEWKDRVSSEVYSALMNWRVVS